MEIVGVTLGKLFLGDKSPTFSFFPKKLGDNLSKKRSAFPNWESGIHGPSNRSEFLNWEAGIHELINIVSFYVRVRIKARIRLLGSPPRGPSPLSFFLFRRLIKASRN